VKHSQDSAQGRVNRHRLLRAIEQRCTFLPRKIRGGIRCVADNGWRYTFRRGLYWIRVKTARVRLSGLKLNTEPRSPRVTVCLSSTAERAELLEQVIVSLFMQTLKPDRIVLWLPQSPGGRALPHKIARLTKRGLEIRLCSFALADCGLAQTITAYPEDIVVTAGDVVRANPDMLRLLYEAYRKNPDMIHCHGAAQVRVSPETGLITWSESAEGYPVPSYCNLPRLALGCLVPPHTPGADVPSGGDEQVWLSLLAHGVKANVIDQPCADAETVATLLVGQTEERSMRLSDIAGLPVSTEELVQRLTDEQREMDLLTLARKTPQSQKNYDYYKALDPALYRAEITLWYETVMQKRLDIDHPKSYNEKLQWMKLHDSTPLKALLTDKFGMRDWLAERIGGEYLVKLYGVWDNADDIDFDSLPEKFVLKATHGSSWVIVVRDKRTLDIPQTREKLNSWLAINFAFVTGLELHYMSIQPKIIAEEYMENAEGDLFDYKLWYFDGKLHSIMFLSERRTGGLKMSYYSPDWERIDLSYDYPRHDKLAEKPQKLDEMIALSNRIAEGFAHVRVDLYLLNDGQIKLGEITFTSASGACHWSPPEADRVLGDLFALPEPTPMPRP